MISLAQKVSVSMPSHLLHFVKEYKQLHHLKSDSEVVALALKKLEKSHLELCYAQSSRELETELGAQELALWDNTLADGLESEDW